MRNITFHFINNAQNKQRKGEITEQEKGQLDSLLSRLLQLSEEELNSCGYQISVNLSDEVGAAPIVSKPSGIILDEKKTFHPYKLSDQELEQLVSPQQVKKHAQLLRSQTRDILILTKQAYKNWTKLIDFGERTKKNAKEQMGLMVGTVSQNRKRYIGIVTHFIMADSWSSRIEVDVSHSDWASMEKEIDRLQEARKDDFRYLKVGWWHTHPDMQVFMSQTDRDTQKKYFNKDWQFALVINPRPRNTSQGNVGIFCGGGLHEASFIISESM